MPLISVVIPVYNVERFVEECLRSVFAQTMHDFEVIIVDDCSTDGSMDIVRRVCRECSGDINVHILSTGKPSGVSVARNIGIDTAIGKYVYFIDSDDYISPDALKHLSVLGLRYPKAHIIFGSSVAVGVAKETYQMLDIASRHLPEYLEGSSVPKLLLKDYYLPVAVWNKLYDREWLNLHNLRFTPGILAQDMHLGFFIAKYADRMALCEQITYYYRVRNDNVSNSKKKQVQASLDWILCDWSHHLTFKALFYQVLYILNIANDSFLFHRGPDAPVPPIYRKIPCAILHWARLMRRYTPAPPIDLF